MSVPLLQQMRQLQVHAMDVHHIMANRLARSAGQPRWCHRRNLLARGIGGPYADFARTVLKDANIKIFDYL